MFSLPFGGWELYPPSGDFLGLYSKSKELVVTNQKNSRLILKNQSTDSEKQSTVFRESDDSFFDPSVSPLTCSHPMAIAELHACRKIGLSLYRGETYRSRIVSVSFFRYSSRRGGLPGLRYLFRGDREQRSCHQAQST